MMPTRLVFVGHTQEGKLFYNVDANTTEKNALFVDKQEVETPVDLVSFIASNPNMTEVRSTPFHKFLWDGLEGQNADRWQRTFMDRSQPVDESLLKNIEVKKKPKKRLVATNKNNQVMAFKSLSFSQQFEKMPNSALGGRRPSSRSITGINTKIIGTIRAGYDGDNDGFVDDGLPTMRPFIPGVDRANIPPPRMQRTGGMRIRTSSSPVNRFAPVSGDDIRQTIINQDKFLEKRFNGGQPITSVGDIKRILMAELPGFSNGTSSFDFLDGPDDQPLEPHAYENIAGFLMVLHANPSMKKLNFEMKKFDLGEEMGVGGSTRYQSGYQWKSSNGQLIQVKDRTPKIVIKYRHPMDPMYKSTSIFNSFDQGRFDVSSNIIGSSMLDSLIKELGGSVPGNELRQMHDGVSYTQMAEIVDNLISKINIVLLPNVDEPLPGVDEQTMAVIQRAQNDGVIPDDMFSNGATIRNLKQLRNELRQHAAEKINTISDETRMILAKHEEIWNAQARATAIHEATHAAHLSQMHEDMMMFLNQLGVDPSTSMPVLPMLMIEKMDKKKLHTMLGEASDINAIAFNKMFSQIITHLMNKVATSGNQQGKSSLRDFTEQPIYKKDGSTFKINKELADLMNELESTLGVGIFGSGNYKDGDNLTMWQVHALTDERVISLQRRDARQQFAGIKLYSKRQKSVANNLLTLFREHGYPALMTPTGSTKPLSQESGKLIADASNSAMGTVSRMISSGVDIGSLRNVSSFRNVPTDSVGPLYGVNQLTMHDIDDLAKSDNISEMTNIAQASVMSVLPATISGADPATTGIVIENTAMDFWHFDSLKDDEITSIIDMARRSAEPGYRNYMATALNQRFISFLNSAPDSSELMAELAVYDAFGIPIRVHDEIDGRATSKRALTSEEIKTFEKLLNWLFPKGKLSNINGAK